MDSDWGSDATSHLSQTDFYLKLADGLISWTSHVQKIIVYSSTEAEYMTLSDCAHQVTWIQSLLGELGYKLKAIPICGDNQGSIFMASNPVTEPHSKHINICYHGICESVAKGNVELFFIDGAENPADLLTKNLPHEVQSSTRLTISLWQHLAPYSLKCSTYSTARGECWSHTCTRHKPSMKCTQDCDPY